MSNVGPLTVSSRTALKLSKAQAERIWEQFIKGAGTSHSGRAGTLQYVMNRCEAEGVHYTLSAMPGVGYFIRRGVE